MTRLMFAVPSPRATAGGLALATPMLLEDLRKDPRLVVRTFPFGRWRDREPAFLKVLHQGLDLARYPFRILRHAPDIVHLNSSFDRRALLRDVAFAAVTRLLRRKLFLMWHGTDVDLLGCRRWPWRALRLVLMRCVDGVGLLSGEEREALARQPQAPRGFQVCNGLDLPRYATRCDVRTRWNLAPGSPVLLFISRLIPAKGLQDTLRALPDVVARHGAHLIVVGDGPDRAPAERLARELRIEAAVHFAGMIPETEALEYYCGSDVLVFPTYHPEGFPMTLFQAVAAGMGIVTTRIRAAADYLREPDHCLFVPPRDPGRLAGAIGRLLADPDLLRRMGRSNRELARKFDRRAVAAEFVEIYAELLHSPGTRRSHAVRAEGVPDSGSTPPRAGASPR